MRLASEPALSSMVITREGVWDNRYPSPNGEEWPEGTSSYVKVTNRAGADLAELEGNVLGNEIRYTVEASDLESVPDGANFEMFIVLPDEETYEEYTYKVRYGRVVRRQVSYPANPANSTLYTGALFTDSVGLRDILGPLWVQKKNKTVMHDNAGLGLPYGMGNDFIFFDSSATHWYAPLKSDSQKVQVSTMKLGGGQLVVVLCSNYSMTNWIGIKFNCFANNVQAVTGSPVGADTWYEQGSAVGNTVAGTPDTYTVSFDYPSSTISVYKGTSLTPLLTWTDSTGQCGHGEGHRYTGLIYLGGLLTAGPQVTYWSAKDDL